MRTNAYRATVIGCALSWFLLGLHLPAVHGMAHHGRALPPWAPAVIGLLAAAALTAMVMLLRARRPSTA